MQKKTYELDLTNSEASEVKYKSFVFNDGEPHIEVYLDDSHRKNKIRVITRIRDSKDLFVLSLVSDVLNRNAIPWELKVLYLMSQRMDRVMDFNRPYSLDVVIRAINAMKPFRLTVIEPHFLERPYSLDSSIEYVGLSMVISNPEEYSQGGKCIFIGADESALKRAKVVGVDYDFFFVKKRDLSSGKILSIEPNEELKEVLNTQDDLEIVVVDDLCDGGYTFKLIADVLENLGFTKRTIIIGHLVNKNGLRVLRENYDRVFIADTYSDWSEEIKEDDNVTINKYSKFYGTNN